MFWKSLSKVEKIARRVRAGEGTSLSANVT